MRTERIGNYYVYFMQAGAPLLAVLGLAPETYKERCRRAGKELNAISLKLEWQGPSPKGYDERKVETHEILRKLRREKESLPEDLTYFLEDEVDLRLREIETYLTSR